MFNQIRTALEATLARKQMTQEQLGTILGITQQAIDKWCERNQVPRRRIDQLAEIFGHDSEIVRAADEARPLLGATRLSRASGYSQHQNQQELPILAPKDRFFDQLREDRHRFFDRLKAEIPAAQVNASLTLGGMPRRFDFATRGILAQVYNPEGLTSANTGRVLLNTAGIARRVIDLAVARRKGREESGVHALILVLPQTFGEPYVDVQLEKTKFDATTLGVSLYLAHSYMDALQLLVDIDAHINDDHNPEDDEED